MKQTERERVFLVKNLPADLNKYQPITIQVGDFFDSNSADALKIRRKGDHCHLIKKHTNSALERIEHVIDIKPGEFDALIKATIQSHKKLRYFYPYGKYLCELDCYQDRLNGYVRVEVEFETEQELLDFTPPEWFGDEITEINHEIHENLGIVTFAEMKERYSKKGINLFPVFLSAN
ncbi:MAG: hypothetical protein NTX82_00480 [Candidatus Parcubacteria bacterium]|nr:hypothetical protein [Candidatus Parcubacteria bacterium]